MGQSPAAVFVITNEMIRRSGAKTIPEVLRMVPGVEVAQIDSNKWAVSIRGFGGRFANDLLVQIDGRDRSTTRSSAASFGTCKTCCWKTWSGSRWSAAPGPASGALNAVNGVINIITKSAKDTQGVYFESGGGTHEQGFSSAPLRRPDRRRPLLSHLRQVVRHGDYYSPDFHATDAWQQVRGGFRMDWRASAQDNITFQGDYYNGYDGDEAVFAHLHAPGLYRPGA